MICISQGGVSLPSIVWEVAAGKLLDTSSGSWLATALDAKATAHQASLIGTKAVLLKTQVFPRRSHPLFRATSIVRGSRSEIASVL